MGFFTGLESLYRLILAVFAGFRAVRTARLVVPRCILACLAFN